jgi:16S rRNA (cytosine967-C5)-methyltransferase
VRARRAALDALTAVHERDAYANLVLPGLLRSRGLTGADAARATDLTYGTLRGTGTYDRIIEQCSSRPLPMIDLPVRDALRLGVYQLLGDRVPAHAAVSTTVDLARRRSGAGAARFVNAVLRRVADRDLAGWVQAILGPDPDPREHLALLHMHPRWVVDALADALGSEVDRLPAVLAANNEPPQVVLAAVPGRATVAELVEDGASARRWAPTAATAPAGDPRQVRAVAQGRARVQDEGSQVVTMALLAASCGTGRADDRWLDMCAGPGGKAALLAGLAAQRGAVVLAADLHRHRAALVDRAVTEAGLRSSVGVVQADGTQPPWAGQTFTRVLLDAPCTGLGALRRRPEARWRRSPSDLQRLVPLQRTLLDRALDSVAVGGVVGYVTCSPHAAETVEVVDSVLTRRSDTVVVDAPSLAQHVPDAARGPYLQLWPDRHGTDAMFLAVLRRTRRVG